MITPFLDARNLHIYLPLRRARLKRRMISGNGTSGGDIAHINGQPYVAALQDINFRLSSGDCVALIGRNGSGKTTLLRTLAGIYELSGGALTTQGNVATMFSSALSLSDLETGRKNIYYSSILHGISTQHIKKRIPEITEICGLGKFIDIPVSMYSDGMRARLGMALAIIATPDIMLIDEAITATDMHFIRSIDEQAQLFSNPEAICVMATHSREIQDRYCNKALWLDRGRLRAYGPYKDIRERYDRYCERN